MHSVSVASFTILCVEFAAVHCCSDLANIVGQHGVFLHAFADHTQTYLYGSATVPTKSRTDQPDRKSNPNPYPNPNTTLSTKQHAIVNIQQNIGTCPMYPDKFIGDMLLHRLCYFRL